MTRGIAGLLLFVVIVWGTPVANIALMWLVGTHEVTYNPGRPDAYTAISGAAAPRPAWLPRLPRSVVVTAHQVISGQLDGFGKVDLASTLSLDEVRSFYTRKLSDIGFKVHESGISPLPPQVADFLGIAATLLAERQADSPEEYKWVSVQIRTEEGWFFKTRYVSVQWRRTRPETFTQENIKAP